MSERRSFPPIEALVPHRGAMLWIERVITGDAEAIEAQAVVPRQAWYLEHGRMPAWLGIELMAQALSAHVGLRGWLANRPPRPGVLLGCRSYRAAVAAFEPGTVLLIRARLAYRDESGFAAYDCAIHRSGPAIAEATLKVYEPADFAAFLAAAEAQ